MEALIIEYSIKNNIDDLEKIIKQNPDNFRKIILNINQAVFHNFSNLALRTIAASVPDHKIKISLALIEFKNIKKVEKIRQIIRYYSDSAIHHQLICELAALLGTKIKNNTFLFKDKQTIITFICQVNDLVHAYTLENKLYINKLEFNVL
jgi:hypothetical protein